MKILKKEESSGKVLFGQNKGLMIEIFFFFSKTKFFIGGFNMPISINTCKAPEATLIAKNIEMYFMLGSEKHVTNLLESVPVDVSGQNAVWTRRHG